MTIIGNKYYVLHDSFQHVPSVPLRVVGVQEQRGGCSSFSSGVVFPKQSAGSLADRRLKKHVSASVRISHTHTLPADAQQTQAWELALAEVVATQVWRAWRFVFSGVAYTTQVRANPSWRPAARPITAPTHILTTSITSKPVSPFYYLQGKTTTSFEQNPYLSSPRISIEVLQTGPSELGPLPYTDSYRWEVTLHIRARGDLSGFLPRSAVPATAGLVSGNGWSVRWMC